MCVGKTKAPISFAVTGQSLSAPLFMPMQIVSFPMGRLRL